MYLKNKKKGIGVPIHVRASRQYNSMIIEKNINTKYEEIKKW